MKVFEYSVSISDTELQRRRVEIGNRATINMGRTEEKHNPSIAIDPTPIIPNHSLRAAIEAKHALIYPHTDGKHYVFKNISGKPCAVATVDQSGEAVAAIVRPSERFHFNPHAGLRVIIHGVEKASGEQDKLEIHLKQVA